MAYRYLSKVPSFELVPDFQSSSFIFLLFQSKIIQILDPQFVADQVVDATLSNKAIIMLPWWTSYLIMLKVPFLLVLVHM